MRNFELDEDELKLYTLEDLKDIADDYNLNIKDILILKDKISIKKQKIIDLLLEYQNEETRKNKNY
jgi:hypothetical protein